MLPQKLSKTPLTACLLLLSLPSLLIAEDRTQVDRLGDPLPPGAVMRLGSGRFLHGYRSLGPSRLAFIPGDKQIFAMSSDAGYGNRPPGAGLADEAFCAIWDRTTGREVRRFRLEERCWCAAASPDGKMFATGEVSGQLTVWDVKTGKPLWRDRGKDRGEAIAWSPDARMLAYEFGGGFKLTDAGTGKVRHQIATGSDSTGMHLVFHPGGKQLVAWCSDSLYHIYDIATGKELRRVEGDPFDLCKDLIFSPNGRTVVACTYEQRAGRHSFRARLWDFATGKLIRTLPSRTIISAAFSADSRFLATGGNDFRISLWDLTTHKPVRQWKATGEFVIALAFSTDGKVLASMGNDRRIRLWDPNTGKETFPFQGHIGAIHAVAFGANEKTLISSGEDQTIRLWDWVTGEEKIRIPEAGNKGAIALAYSPDGKTIASVGENVNIELWDVQTGRMGTRFGPKYWDGFKVAFFPDGKSLASVYRDSVHICESRTGKLLRRIENPWNVGNMAMAANGKTIALVTAREGVVVWDINAGKRRPRPVNGTNCGFLALSADGSVLASVDGKSLPRFWNSYTGELLRDGESRGDIQAVALSLDGTMFAGAVDRNVILWDLPTGKVVRTFKGHLGTVHALAFNPSGKVLVSAGYEGTLLAWDLSGLLVKGRLSSVKMTPKEMEDQWKALVGDDPARAYQAGWSLAACPQVVSFFQKHMRPGKQAGLSVPKLIADLDDESFAVREKASAALESLGDIAAPALKKALAAGPSLEVKRRNEKVLKKIKPPSAAELIRIRRALLVLERSPSPEARRLLETLAAGAPGTYQTEEARAALWRLDWRR
jgi:WD40 repeat protein